MFKSASTGKTAGIDTVSAAFQAQRENMRLCHDLMGGTKAMLDAGPRYIPQKAGRIAKAGKRV